MPIEFRCSRCGKLLRTPDGTAGRQAQCPECGTIGAVPGETPSAGSPGETPPEPAGFPPVVDNPMGSSQTAPIGPAFKPALGAGYERSTELYASAAQRVAAPATALTVIGWVTAVLSLLAALFLILCIALVASGAPVREGHALHGEEQVRAIYGCSVYLALTIVWIALSILIMIGARKMRRLEGYGLAMTATIVALVPCIEPCCLLTFPFGIWALTVLSDNAVKAAFRR
ncbi:MAG: hypothetical protein LLG00_05875 [Planctomycetaceae bacterium]|nr:hypothetical protein [Planctomycetaceae bacterium]